MAAGRTRQARKPEPPARRPLEFLASGRDQSLAEFEHQFGSTLPHMVMVTQDGYAEDRKLKAGQVYTFQAISKQERAVAKAVDGDYPDLYSLPVVLNQTFTVLDQDGKATVSDGCLYSLLKTHKLPVKVQFSRDHVPKADVVRTDARDTSQIELLYKFNETHVLCNLIEDDTVQDDVIYVPLHASSLRVALVTGVNGMANEVFKRVKANIDHACLAYEYDLHYGRIAVGVHEPASLKGQPVTRFSKPSYMTEFSQLFNKPIQEVADSESSSFYDVPVPNTSADADDEHYDVLNTVTREQTGESGKTNSRESCDSTKNRTGKTGKPIASPRSLPPTPPKVANSRHTATCKEPVNENTPLYTNDIPRGEATAFVNTTKASKIVENTVAQSQNAKSALNTSNSGTEEPTGSTCTKNDNSTAIDIGQLTISGVCDYLKLLRLDCYSEKFQDQMVDGELLKEVDEDLLVSDFGFRKIEARRLMKFVKEGHIPK